MDKTPELIQRSGIGTWLLTALSTIVADPQLLLTLIGIVLGLVIQVLGVWLKHLRETRYFNQQLKREARGRDLP